MAARSAATERQTVDSCACQLLDSAAFHLCFEQARQLGAFLGGQLERDPLGRSRTRADARPRAHPPSAGRPPRRAPPPTLRPPRCCRRPMPRWPDRCRDASAERQVRLGLRTDGRVQRGAPDHRHHDQHRHGGRRGPRRQRAPEPRTHAGGAGAGASPRTASLTRAREVIPEERRRLRQLVARASARALRASASACARQLSQARGVPRRSAGSRAASSTRSTNSVSVEVSHGSGLQKLLQIRQRVKEVGLHRANRAAEDPGDLVVRQLVVHAQNQRRPLLASAAARWRRGLPRRASPRMSVASARSIARCRRGRAPQRLDASAP